jgi:hypothetical protein
MCAFGILLGILFFNEAKIVILECKGLECPKEEGGFEELASQMESRCCVLVGNEAGQG